MVIKFKAWNTLTNKWINEGKPFGPLNTLTNSYSDGTLEFDLFTGNKDSKGHGIYWGDILDWKNKNGKDHAYGVVSTESEWLEFYLSEPKDVAENFCVEDWASRCEKWYNFTIVGNIRTHEFFMGKLKKKKL